MQDQTRGQHWTKMDESSMRHDHVVSGSIGQHSPQHTPTTIPPHQHQRQISAVPSEVAEHSHRLKQLERLLGQLQTQADIDQSSLQFAFLTHSFMVVVLLMLMVVMIAGLKWNDDGQKLHKKFGVYFLRFFE